MKCFVACVLSGAFFCTSAQAQVLEPKVYEGDGWFYTTTSSNAARAPSWLFVSKIQDKNIFTERSNGELASYTKPWILERVKYPGGRVMDFSVAGKAAPYTFPLHPGDEQTAAIRMPGGVSKDRFVRTQILGWEKVKVPAGTFDALKISIETWIVSAGKDTIDYAAASASRVTQWYAPEVKNYVRRVERNAEQSSVVSELHFYVTAYAAAPTTEDINNAMQHLAVDLSWNKAAELGLKIGTQLLLQNIEKKGYLSEQQTERVACVMENFSARTFVDEVTAVFVENAPNPQVLIALAKFMETEAGQQLSALTKKIVADMTAGKISEKSFDPAEIIKNFDTLSVQQLDFFNRTALGKPAFKLLADSPKHIQRGIERLKVKVREQCIDSRKI
jgi:hypothetical protein